MTRRWTVESLAEFACRTPASELPETAFSAAERCVLDLMGAAAAGWGAPSARAVREMCCQTFSPGPCPVWFGGTGLGPAPATLANSAAASALDLDDGHRAAGGHPGAAVVPAALAAASGPGTDGAELLAAVVVGYEVGVRVAAARDPRALDTFSTGRWCAYGATAAAGRILGVDPGVLARALAIGGVLSPGLSAAGYSRLMGNSAKEGIPWATFTGLTALDLAARGWTGPLDILDHPAYYDPRRILAGLGDQPFAVERTYFKPYGCCRWIHAALDAMLDVLHEHRIDPGAIRQVEVHTFGRAARLSNEPAPATLEGAQYSIPFCLAAAAVLGARALLPTGPELLGDPRIEALARKVRVVVDPSLDALFPEQTPARLLVRTDRGAWERRVDVPLGDPERPMDRAALEAKLRALCRGRIPRERQDRILAAVADLRRAGPAPLLDAVAPEARPDG